MSALCPCCVWIHQERQTLIIKFWWVPYIHKWGTYCREHEADWFLLSTLEPWVGLLKQTPIRKIRKTSRNLCSGGGRNYRKTWKELSRLSNGVVWESQSGKCGLMSQRTSNVGGLGVSLSKVWSEAGVVRKRLLSLGSEGWSPLGTSCYLRP